MLEFEAECKELRDVESSLEKFMNLYMAEVGPLIEEMEGGGGAAEGYRYRNDASEVALGFKQLYKRLARAYHPDSNQGKEAAEFMQMVNAAYRARDYAGLKRIEIFSVNPHNSSEPDYQTEVRLQLKMLSLRNAIHKVRARKLELRASDEYYLMQRYIYSKYDGIDFISGIKASISQEIAMLR